MKLYIMPMILGILLAIVVMWAWFLGEDDGVQ